MILARVPYKKIEQYKDIIMKDNLNIELTLEYDDLIIKDEINDLEKRIKTVHLPFFDINLGSKNKFVVEKSQEILIKTCHMIEIFSLENAVLHHNYSPYHYAFMEDEFIDRFVGALKEILDDVKPDFCISLENVFEDTPFVIHKILDKMKNYNVKVCFDFGHFNLFSKVELSYWLKLLKDEIVEFHIHNNYGIRDEHNPLDKGTFDYLQAFDIIVPKILVIENNNIDDFRTSAKILEKILGGRDESF